MKATTARCRQIVASYHVGQHLAANDLVFVVGLVDRHPRADEKIGAGIVSVSIVANPMGTRGFWLHRVDGTGTDVSWTACLRKTPGTHQDEVRHALRRVIGDDIAAFKEQRWSSAPYCAVTGKRLAWSDAHVDHAPPTFVTLADRWAAGRDGYPSVRLSSQDGRMGRRLSADDEADWYAFHTAHARLRLINKNVNLSVLRRKTMKEAS